jgi:pimeloyl-ACP methyl ester carboxylesterase
MALQIEDHYIEVNGIRLHVVSAGERTGKLLIFLHGFPEFWFGWRKQIEYFANKGYWVLAPDQRGYNLSDKPRPVYEYRVSELARDIAGIINWSGRENATVVGHDWGGAVAWILALTFPKMVEKLIILNVPHPRVMKHNLTRNLKQLFKSWYIFFFQAPLLPEVFLSMRGSERLRDSLRNTSRPGTFSDEDLAEYQKAWNQPGAIRTMLNWYRASLQTKPKRVRAPLVTMPTLIIWGEQDAFLSKEMAAQSLEYCVNGKLERFPNATHWVQHEEADRVNELIFKFVEKP